MKNTQNWQKILNVVLSMGLVLQLIAPVMPAKAASAYAPEAAHETLNIERTALAAERSTLPPALSQPLTIARTQTSYSSNSPATISYHITNNLPPTLMPEVPPGATITDTLHILADFDLTTDMNTLRGVSLSTTILNGTITDPGAGDQMGADVTWALPDLPPGQTIAATMTVQTPAAATDFLLLDTGAQVTALRWGDVVSTSALPAHIIPDSVDADFLAATIDADSEDYEMLWFSGKFSQDPEAAFQAVQAFDFDAYKGSLRGTRGTIWGAAGNSIDKASTLIAMLRAAGIPARYRTGTLSLADAQVVLGSMFPPVSGVAGYIPPGTATSDPLNDIALLAIVQDHWWVEAYLPGGDWTDLDPTYPGAAVGQSFATPGAGDRVAELPDALRHYLELTLRVQQYSQFPIGSNSLIDSHPLSITVPIPQVAAKELVLGHILQSDRGAGMVFGSVQHTYTPYFVLDNWGLYAGGEPYQDLLSNFPLASKFTIGQWLEFKLTDPDGEVTEYERVVKDLMGPDVRIGGGTPQIALPGGDGALVSNLDQFVTWVLPNSVDSWVAARLQTRSVSQVVEIAGLVAAILDWTERDTPLTPEEQLQYSETVQEAQFLLSTLLGNGSISFAANADRLMAEREEGMLVAQYFDSPRIFSFGSSFNPITEETIQTVDLRKTDAATIPYPGQALSAGATANWIKGLTESRLEGEALDAISDVPEPAFTTYRLFEAMADQNIQPMLLGPGDLALLDSLNLLPAQYYYAALALLEGDSILIPSQSVEWDGEPRFAFWHIDPVSGETIGVGEDGLHVAAVGYANQTKIIYNNFSKPAIKWMAKKVEALYDYLVANIVPALGGRRASATAWFYLDDHVCPVAVCGIEQFFSDAAPAPIELPPQLFAYISPVAGAEMAQAVVSGGTAGAFSVGVTPAAGAIDVGEQAAFTASLSQPGGGSFLAAVYAPDGWQIALDNSGEVTAVHPAGIAPGEYDILLAAQSTQDRSSVSSAVHTVTINAGDDLAAVITPEPNITIHVNDAQLPGAAFTVELHNRSTNPHIFTVDAAGIPAADLILNGVQGLATTQVTLAAGELRQVGLYYTPASLPAPGAQVAFDITAAMDAPPLTDGSSASSTISALAYPHLSSPPAIYVAAGGTTSFPLTLENVGNAGGSFALSASAPPGWALGNLNTPVILDDGAEETQLLELTAASGTSGQRYPVFLTAQEGETIMTIQAEAVIVSPESARIFAAAHRCPVNQSLGTALEALAVGVVELEYWCASGDCPFPLRDNAANAGQLVASRARVAVSPITLPGLTGVQAASSTLAASTTNGDILAAVSDLSQAIASLSEELCIVEGHRVSGRFNPYVQAILTGAGASFDLEVTNQGTLTTTYAITITGSPGGDLLFNPTISPGATLNLPITPTALAPGNFNLSAEIVADQPDPSVAVLTTAAARLNVVDRFVQVLRLVVDPPFVETGVSTTTLSAEIANFAGVAIQTDAAIAVLASDGTAQFTSTIPIQLLAGNPRLYALTNLDTSGWEAGVYTVTLQLLDSNDSLVPDGSGYGFFSVGQGLQLSQAVRPEIVAPGTLTVTTVITSALQSPEIARSHNLSNSNSHISTLDSLRSAPNLYRAPLSTADRAYLNARTDAPQADLRFSIEIELPLGALQPAENSPGTQIEESNALELHPPEDDRLPLTPIASTLTAEPLSGEDLTAGLTAITIVDFTPVFTRLEQNDPAWSYTGTWTNVTLARASGGSHWRNATSGSTASLTFEGDWLNLGFIADRFSGNAEIFINGNSQGILDLYRSEEAPISYHFNNLGGGTHTLVIEVLGTSNPFASSTRVQLDYADFGDGSPLPDGAFEQDDERVLKSSGWSTTNYAGASGGSYIRSSSGTAWFPFTGDSFSLQTIAYTNGGKARLFVNNIYLDTIDMFQPVFEGSAITRTFSYTGFGPGNHVLQIMSYQDQVTLDRLTTPGTEPFIDPNPPVTGITRFEADHPTIRFNGYPFTQTAWSWVRIANINANRASAGEYIYSAAAGDTISFQFDGTWLGVGFATDRSGGQADIAIDGQFVQEVDLYTADDDTASFYFRDLAPGTHTVTITVLGTNHPNASGARVYLDFFDVWDGEPLPTGTFEEGDPRLIYSNGWSRSLNTGASGGGYAVNSTNFNSTVWFPFTGNSITYQAWTWLSYQDVDIRLNGVSLGLFDLYSSAAGVRPYSFDNLGDGPHVLEIRRYRGDAVTLDAFFTPAITPGYVPPAPAPFVRHEENHPEMRYNGDPYTTRSQNWSQQSNFQNSASYNLSTAAAGNRWSLDFEGAWVNVGFRSSGTSGTVEIFIDSISLGLFDTSGGVNNVKNFPFGGLPPGPHTIEVIVVSGTVMPDYMDVWGGQPVDNGWYNAQLENETSGLIHFSQRRWWIYNSDVYGFNGDYLSSFTGNNGNIWFTFAGADLTILGYQRAGSSLGVIINGVDQGVFDMGTPSPFRDQPTALHFPDLGEGPHIIQVSVPSQARIDAFEVNPDGLYSYMPEIKWYDAAPSEPGANPSFYNNGLMSTIAIGDLNGDGQVELVAPSTNGVLYVYRGDGGVPGRTAPLLWSTDVVGVASEPALVDLNNNGQAEIIISGYNGTFAFAHDGTQRWHNPAPKAYTSDSGGTVGWGGPTIGNLDLDPEPEIVIAASQDAVYVLDHQGNTLWSTPIGRWPTVPVLADITGDGILDIIVAQDYELTVYDYFNGGQIAWTYIPTGTVNHLGGQGAFGAPAVADLNGDGRPEIIINWGHMVDALQDDGTLLWRYDSGQTNLYRPSPVTMADVTGDGEMNIVTASAINSGFLVLSHLLMVLDADGNLVWSQNVGDTSASASGVAAQDLTGDGAWEIIWNGSQDGLLIIRGSDGKRLFNEPYTGSGTVMEYPSLGDVDGDGVADIVLGGTNGIFVISHIGHWADSRPLWNQHNYHVTSINDDWSIPVNEPDSWLLHNTYRTQTPDRTPAPAYQLVFTYTAGTPDVAVLTNTASISLTANPPLYEWAYRQEWVQPLITTTFDSLLTGLQPGEMRQVAAGTTVAYRLPGGYNYLTMPPLYVTAPHVGSLSPSAQSTVIGGTAIFTLTLVNPGSAPDVYALQVSGIPDTWLDYPAVVPIGAGETMTLPIPVTVPPATDPDTFTLWFDVETGSGADAFAAELTIFDGLALALNPATQSETTGQPLTYTLVITNLEGISRSYTLTSTGLADVLHPAQVAVGGNQAETLIITATPSAPGPQPFSIEVRADSGAHSDVEGIAVGIGRFGLQAIIRSPGGSPSPTSAVTGPGATAAYTLTLTNIGDSPERAALSLEIPTGWTAELTLLNTPVDEIDLPAVLFNQSDLLLLVTPDENALPGIYPITVTAQSLYHPGTIAVAAATAVISERGVRVAISPEFDSIDPTTPTTWDVTITNLGSLPDTFDLTMSGIPALAGLLSASSVSLAPGASETVQLTASDLRFVLPGVQQFAVMAQSQADGDIRAQALASFTVPGFTDLSVTWRPAATTVTNTLTASLVFVITNTGNLMANYQFTFEVTGTVATLGTANLSIPPRSAAAVLVQVSVPEAGSFNLMGTAAADGVLASAVANLKFVQVEENPLPYVLYLPIIFRGP